jgi:signal transduction histidine kinase
MNLLAPLPREVPVSAVVAEQRSVLAARPVSTVFARRGILAVLAVVGLLGAVGGALLVATSDHLVDPIAWGVQIGVMILGAVAASLTWLARRPGNRVGLILLALAVSTAILSLQGATQPLLHSLGVAVEPVFFLLAYYAVFAFPDGRLGGWFEKALLAGMALYFLTGFVPYLFFSPAVGGGAPLAGCTADCPTNALMIADRPTIAASYGSDGSYLVIAIMSATLACLLYRVAKATRPRRRALLPVYVPAVVLTVPLLIFHGVVTQLLHLEASTIWDVGWVVTVARCALPFGFLLAIVQTTFFAATALKTIVGRLVDNPNAAQLRKVLADALDDPALEFAFRVEGTDTFVDSHGLPVTPTPPPGRSATPLVRNGETAAIIVHDAALDSDPELVATAGQALLLVLEKGRLLTELDSTTAELRASRARIVAAGDAERRRFERDLHDGAQQHLVALRIRVGLVSELAEADPQVALRLEGLGTELEEILQELRDIARGLNPPVLREFGLGEALASVSRRSASPPTLETAGIGRYAEEIETAVYFCCLEGLQNVGKHAGDDASAVLRLWERDGELFLELQDDGAGCDLESARASGSGLTNMTDRIAALGGAIAVESTPGVGTTVRGSVPVAELAGR